MDTVGQPTQGVDFLIGSHVENNGPGRVVFGGHESGSGYLALLPGAHPCNFCLNRTTDDPVLPLYPSPEISLNHRCSGKAC